MKYLILSLMILTSCTFGGKVEYIDEVKMLKEEQIAIGVWRVKDENTTCYLYYQTSISCVKTE